MLSIRKLEEICFSKINCEKMLNKIKFSNNYKENIFILEGEVKKRVEFENKLEDYLINLKKNLLIQKVIEEKSKILFMLSNK